MEEFEDFTKKLARLVIEKLGPRRNETQVSVEVSPEFDAFLRHHYRLAGRWEPRHGADHERLLADSAIDVQRLWPLLEVAYQLAVVHFKVRVKRNLTYIDSRGQRQTIDCEIHYLDCRFTTEEVPEGAW